MTVNKLKRIGLGAVVAGFTALALGACADGSSRGYYSAEYGTSYRDNGYHHGYRGHDRDRDGIPNRYDRDRDGDGVPNRYDDSPNNPNRN